MAQQANEIESWRNDQIMDRHRRLEPINIMPAMDNILTYEDSRMAKNR